MSADESRDAAAVCAEWVSGLRGEASVPAETFTRAEQALGAVERDPASASLSQVMDAAGLTFFRLSQGERPAESLEQAFVVLQAVAARDAVVFDALNDAVARCGMEPSVLPEGLEAAGTWLQGGRRAGPVGSGMAFYAAYADAPADDVTEREVTPATIAADVYGGWAAWLEWGGVPDSTVARAQVGITRVLLDPASASPVDTANGVGVLFYRLKTEGFSAELRELAQLVVAAVGQSDPTVHYDLAQAHLVSGLEHCEREPDALIGALRAAEGSLTAPAPMAGVGARAPLPLAPGGQARFSALDAAERTGVPASRAATVGSRPTPRSAP